MNPEVQKKPGKLSKRNVVIISLVSFSLLMLAIAAQLLFSVLNNKTVYEGVYIGNISVGGFSKEQIVSELKRNYQDQIDNAELTLKIKDISENLKFTDLSVTYDIQNAADKAYSIGRTGNAFNRLMEIIKAKNEGVHLDLNMSYDKNRIDEVADNLYKKTLIQVKEANLFIQGENAVVRSGHHGESIDKSKVITEIENAIKLCKSGNIEIPIIITSPSKINVDDFYNQVLIKEKNASAKIENNSIKVVPHVLGQSIDKEALIRIVSELEKTEDTEQILPILTVTPKITTDIYYQRLFKDVLSKMETKFNSTSKNDSSRAVNIRLAASKINGKILLPGEEFSFNRIVGKRTEEGGYQSAHTYVGGKIVDGIGGGICQVSTTLYNAVLFSDLKVTERKNHTFTVSYVPYGRDAAVSYGSVDFRFVNSTQWPIKILAEVTPTNWIKFSIVGTNDDPGKTVEITTNTVKTLDYKTKYIDDPNLEQGKTKVREKGMKGYVVDTFKIIKRDGKVISQKKIHTSTYKTLDREILRGTKKVQPKAPTKTTTPASTPTPKPTQQTSGVDDADNPPVETKPQVEVTPAPPATVNPDDVKTPIAADPTPAAQ